MHTKHSPTLRELIFWPAAITLMITLARLASELGGLPAWLASKESGGGGALLGISWLAPVFAVWFALRLRPDPHPFKRLLKVLVTYGLAARIPVILVTFVAIGMDWGTHYEKFGPDDEMGEGLSTLRKVGMTLFAQVVFWIGAWTVGIGMLVGSIVPRFTRRSAGGGATAP